MGDQTSLVSRQEREANAKNQPMFRKRLFKDILIAISGSFRTGTSNTACCMMSSPWFPLTLTIGKLRKRAQQNIPEDSVLSIYSHSTYIHLQQKYLQTQRFSQDNKITQSCFKLLFMLISIKITPHTTINTECKLIPM